MQNHARRFNIPYLTEFSGKKGYHLWIFFDKPYSNRIARALAEAFAFDHEVFPKQNRIGKGKLGNLVKAPLGKHQATDKWCLFLDKDLRPEKNQYEVLTGIRTINPVNILKNDMPEIWVKIVTNRSKIVGPARATAPIKLLVIKDCVRNAIIEGAVEGRRNQVGHIIASELRRLGFSREKAKSVILSIWNRRNRPPLNNGELNLIIESAYGQQGYTYGCKENSLLRQYLLCEDIGNCLYQSILKINRSE